MAAAETREKHGYINGYINMDINKSVPAYIQSKNSAAVVEVLF